MRLISLVPAAFVLFISGPAFAQEWIEYVSRADFFSVNFPAQPEVRDIKWETDTASPCPVGSISTRMPGTATLSA